MFCSGGSQNGSTGLGEREGMDGGDDVEMRLSNSYSIVLLIHFFKCMQDVISAFIDWQVIVIVSL